MNRLRSEVGRHLKRWHANAQTLRAENGASFVFHYEPRNSSGMGLGFGGGYTLGGRKS
jgi:hypothetical protein